MLQLIIKNNMKRKVGELFNKPIVQGNENVLSSNEILVEQKGDTFSLKERKDNDVKVISGDNARYFVAVDDELTVFSNRILLVDRSYNKHFITPVLLQANKDKYKNMFPIAFVEIYTDKKITTETGLPITTVGDILSENLETTQEISKELFECDFETLPLYYRNNKSAEKVFKELEKIVHFYNVPLEALVELPIAMSLKYNGITIIFEDGSKDIVNSVDAVELNKEIYPSWIGEHNKNGLYSGDIINIQGIKIGKIYKKDGSIVYAFVNVPN